MPLNIVLDAEDLESYIKDVRTGKNQDMIVVIVNQTELVDTIFIWNLESDVESGVFEIEGEYEILWDRFGNPYIVS